MVGFTRVFAAEFRPERIVPVLTPPLPASETVLLAEAAPLDAELLTERSLPAEVLPTGLPAEWAALPPAQSLPVRAWRGLCSALEWVFGLVSLLVVLALLSVVPILQFLSLGYLLEASGRIARTGKFSAGFIGIRTLARVGSIVAGTWLMLLPLRFVAGLANDAELANNVAGTRSPVAGAWRLGLFVLTILMLVHLASCWYAGGKFRHFFWPVVGLFRTAKWLTLGLAGKVCRPLLKRIYPAFADDLAIPVPLASWFPLAAVYQGWKSGRMYVGARDAVWDFIVSLRPADYFWLGLRGYAGAFLWLLIPSLFLLGGTRLPPGGLQFVVGWIGALMLMFVSLYLPYLQVNFAAQRRFGAMFEVREVRRFFARAPLAYWFALLVTVAFALPLYLLNIENLPRPLVWIPSLVFTVFIYPARLLTGWAVARGSHREQPRFFLFRWVARLGGIPIVAIYVLFVYLSQFTRWFGEASFFEQHAFLLPVPFLGL